MNNTKIVLPSSPKITGDSKCDCDNSIRVFNYLPSIKTLTIGSNIYFSSYKTYNTCLSCDRLIRNSEKIVNRFKMFRVPCVMGGGSL